VPGQVHLELPVRVLAPEPGEVVGVQAAIHPHERRIIKDQEALVGFQVIVKEAAAKAGSGDRCDPLRTGKHRFDHAP
jgi:hypothetical protein